MGDRAQECVSEQEIAEFKAMVRRQLRAVSLADWMTDHAERVIVAALLDLTEKAYNCGYDVGRTP